MGIKGALTDNWTHSAYGESILEISGEQWFQANNCIYILLLGQFYCFYMHFTYAVTTQKYILIEMKFTFYLRKLL